MGYSGTNGLYEMQQCLVAPVPVTINAQSAESIRTNILGEINRKAVRKIVLDLSDVSVLDSRIFTILQKTAEMTELMGVRTVFAGIQPGVAVALVDLNVETGNLRIAQDLNEAIALLEKEENYE